MIDYIVKYQNNYVYSHLFEYNLVDLLQKGITLTGLFNSDVFKWNFDFDEWPATNADTKKYLSPYNSSMFKIRYQYPKVFKSIYDKDLKKEVLAD
jgi:hypothetical protein